MGSMSMVNISAPSSCTSSPTSIMQQLLTPISRLNALKTPLYLPFCHFPSSSFTSSSCFSLKHNTTRKTLPFVSMASSTTHSSSSSQAVSPGGDVNNVFHLIQKHQETAARLPAVEEIKTVINRITRGALATSSKKHEGYPSGSMVDFACDAYGSPILAVSSLAVHTQDLLANPKCSLLVARDPEDRTDLIINLYGDAVPVPDNETAAVRSAYLEKHPDAFWVDFGDFQFMRIETKAVRYVSGVATALLGSGELTGEEYRVAKVDPIAQFSKPVASHMNRDHGEDTRLIVQHSTKIPVDSAYMLDLDSLGFYVKETLECISSIDCLLVRSHLAGYQGNSFKLRVPFPRRAEDRKDVKTLVVEMLHIGCSAVHEFAYAVSWIPDIQFNMK
ncbi:hypothetical protein ACFE04_022630 [Oxalis oulophora]